MCLPYRFTSTAGCFCSNELNNPDVEGKDKFSEKLSEARLSPSYPLDLGSIKAECNNCAALRRSMQTLSMRVIKFRVKNLSCLRKGLCTHNAMQFSYAKLRTRVT